MATIPYSKTPSGNSRTLLASYAAMANGDDGEPIPFSQYADKSVQVVGAFGVGGSVTIEGSNNGTDWATLKSSSGNALNITSAKIEQVLEITQLIRPRVTAGDGSTNLSVHVLARETP